MTYTNWSSTSLLLSKYNGSVFSYLHQSLKHQLIRIQSTLKPLNVDRVKIYIHMNFKIENKHFCSVVDTEIVSYC